MSEKIESGERGADGDGADVAPAGAAEPVTPDEELEDAQADAAEDFINGLLDALDMDGEAEADIDEGTIFVDVTGPDMGLLIGRHGATLEALQELTRAAVQHQTEARARLTVDVDGYRERQRSILERRVRGIAADVLRDGTPVELEPMSAYDRRIVHSAVADIEGVATSSDGVEPDRYVVIRPA